jgi:hypothetical protein
VEKDALRVVNISRLDDDVVIHFETRGERINAYTLASALVGIADAAKAANAGLNIGYDIEIVVEAIGPGSFRAQLRAVYTHAKNLFSGDAVRTIILSVIASFLYERYFSLNQQIKVEVNTTEVVIQHGQEKVVIPREVYDGARVAEKNPQFVRAINNTITSIAADEKVSAVGFIRDLRGPAPEVLIPHNALHDMESAVDLPPDDSETRIVTEQCDLQIVKAILERSSRKWEFIWRGVKISAPILSDRFYAEFFAHDITIAPGDELKVRLAIHQARDPKLCIYTNVGYEVTEVYGHVSRMRQMPLNGAGTSEPDAETRNQ